MQPILVLHIVGGTLAVVAGYTALFALKGQKLHRLAGMLFAWSMAAMGIGAAVVGLARNKPTWLGGLVVIYYVTTGVRTVRRKGPPISTDLALTGYAVVMALTSLTLTLMYIMHPTADSLKIPLPLALLSPVMLTLAIIGDLRERRFGALAGNRRLARHLWRMCYAMFVATASFFLGQAQVIPSPLRFWPILVVLAILPLPVMFYWLWRFRTPRRC